MNKLAILFAGQGSQYVGMGKDFYDMYAYVKENYKVASDILGYDLSKVCFEESDKLNNTLYTQPSILVTSLSIYEVLKREYQIKPSCVAGFSLGEYSALHAGDVFDFKTIINLIKKRAQFMNDAANETKGSMAAIIGMPREALNQLCEEIDGIVQIANYNCPNQLVVGGEIEAVNILCDKAKEHGAKRAIKLNVSGGFHTPLMNEAAKKMYDEVLKTSYKKPNIDIIMNCTADYLNIDILPALMKKQIESSVYFEDGIRKMIDDGVDTFIEIGPGNVLSNFVKKIDRSKTIITIDQLSDLEKLREVK